jgi:hypothetical protein
MFLTTVYIRDLLSYILVRLILPCVLTVPYLFTVGVLDMTLLLVFKILLDLSASFELPGLISLYLEYYISLDCPSLYILGREPYNQRSPRLICG